MSEIHLYLLYAIFTLHFNDQMLGVKLMHSVETSNIPTMEWKRNVHCMHTSEFVYLNVVYSI